MAKAQVEVLRQNLLQQLVDLLVDSGEVETLACNHLCLVGDRLSPIGLCTTTNYQSPLTNIMGRPTKENSLTKQDVIAAAIGCLCPDQLPVQTTGSEQMLVIVVQSPLPGKTERSPS